MEIFRRQTEELFQEVDRLSPRLVLLKHGTWSEKLHDRQQISTKKTADESKKYGQ